MPNPRVLRILEELRATRFADLQGARVSASIPISERLLNSLVAASLPPGAVVRDVTLHPKAGNRISVRARIARADFLPPLTVTAEIERQPELPDGPLVLRVLSLPGLMALAGAAVSLTAALPPGVRLDEGRLFVDVRILLQRHGLDEWLALMESLRVTAEEGRLIADVTLRV
jgi:hypothetical protein